MTTGGDPAALSQCLELCQALASKGQKFTLNLIHTGTSFTFALDTREAPTSRNTRSVELKRKQKVRPSTSPEKAKKKPSPSTLRRNQRRKEEFQKKKLEELKKGDTTNELEITSQEGSTFKCEYK